MTFEEYILNPMQKQGMVFSAAMREAMRNTYKTKFDNILLREAGKIDHYKFRNKKDNIYYILIKIPSEIVPKFYYEVVIKFWAGSNIEDAGRTLNKYNIEVFSNDPSFNFTYAYVFLKNGLVVKDLVPKLAKLSKKEAPKVTNPEEQVGYVKSLYFAYLYMQQRGVFKVITWSDAEEYDKKKLLGLVQDSDSKIDERIREGKKVDTRKKIEVDEKTARKLNNMNISDTAKSRLVATTKKSPIVKKTKAVNSTKKNSKK
jgi:hypothetical protein